MKLMTVISLLWLFTVSGIAIAQEEGGVVKLATELEPAHPTSQSLLSFQKDIENFTHNQVNIQIFSAAQLGTAQNILDGLQFGSIEIGVLPVDILTSLSPLLATVSMPYIFRDDEHRYRVLDGPIGFQLLESLKSHNLVGLGFFDTGMKNLSTQKQPIKRPEDFQGLHIGGIRDCSETRCANILGELSVRSFAVMGATAVSIPCDEIIEAFRSEKIQGWEGNESTCNSSKMIEAGVTYFTYSKHSLAPDLLVASKLWFDSLSQDTQQAIRKAARLTRQDQHARWANFMQQTVARLENEGMQFSTVSREHFFHAVQPLYARIIKEFGPEFDTLIQAIIAVK